MHRVRGGGGTSVTFGIKSADSIGYRKHFMRNRSRKSWRFVQHQYLIACPLSHEIGVQWCLGGSLACGVLTREQRTGGGSRHALEDIRGEQCRD